LFGEFLSATKKLRLPPPTWVRQRRNSKVNGRQRGFLFNQSTRLLHAAAVLGQSVRQRLALPLLVAFL
jgi:hypothetical protein